MHKLVWEEKIDKAGGGGAREGMLPATPSIWENQFSYKQDSWLVGLCHHYWQMHQILLNYSTNNLSVTCTMPWGRFVKLCYLQQRCIRLKVIGIWFYLETPSLDRVKTWWCFYLLNLTKAITTVFVDTWPWKTKHPRKRFRNFHQSCVLSTDRIEIHQSQPLVWPSDLLYIMLAGSDWWILIRSVDKMYDWRKF